MKEKKLQKRRHLLRAFNKKIKRSAMSEENYSPTAHQFTFIVTSPRYLPVHWCYHLAPATVVLGLQRSSELEIQPTRLNLSNDGSVTWLWLLSTAW
jgi:hypothetical protein